MTITHKLSIDLLRQENTTQIDAVQDDSCRYLALMLHANGIPWTIPTDISAVIRYLKADGVGGEYDALPDGTCAWSAADNVLTIALAPQVLTAAGETALSVMLTDGDRSVSTFDITLRVLPGVHTRIAESDRYVNVSATTAAFESALTDIGARIMRGGISSIVLLGDSITDGAGGTGYNGSYSGDPSTNTDGYCWANVFKKYVEERYGTSVKNLGMYGTQMVTQMNTALPLLSKDDFVIWLTGTNDRNNYDSYAANARSYIDAIKDRCGGLLVISSIPATEADENNHTVNMQKMDELVACAAAGYVPYFSMYQEFVRYCETCGIDLGDCFDDHVHPNDTGYYIMFMLLCRKLGLPLDPYTGYQSDGVWWDPSAGISILAANTTMHSESSFTSGFGTGSGVVPSVYMHGHDAVDNTTALSGKHITQIELLVHTAGVITFGTVALDTLARQKPVYTQSKTFQITGTGMSVIDLDLDIGENETLAIQSTTDTGKLAYIVGSSTQLDPLHFWTSNNFESGTNQCIIVYGTIYGY